MDSLSRLGPPLLLAVPLACVRPPLAGVCPEVQAGALTITEIRGPQAGVYRQWIELYNASDDDIALAGMSLVFTQLDGGLGGRLFIRDEGLVVAPGAHVVLGGGDPGRYGYIDYDYTPDWHSASDVETPRDLPSGGFVDLHACDVLVDRVLLRGLPDAGTLFWPGPPAAADNDDGAAWCVDTVSVAGTSADPYGTPGEVNPACP